jgi:hypothetical protein
LHAFKSADAGLILKVQVSIQYVVQMNESFFRYMASSALKLELNQLLLSEWTEIGRASLSLADVLNSAKNASSEFHRRTLRVFGPGSVDLGKIKVTTNLLHELCRDLIAACVGFSCKLAANCTTM